MKSDQLRRRTKGIGKIKVRDERKYGRNKRKENGQQVFVNKDGSHDSDVECYDDDEDGEDALKIKEGDLQENRVVTKALQHINIPHGILCSECAKIGVYDKNTYDVTRNTSEQTTRDSDSRERCSICQTLGTKVDPQENIRMAVLYSHEFYDKYSRDKRPGVSDSGESTTRENSIVKLESSKKQSEDKIVERLEKEKSFDRTEPNKSYKRSGVNGIKTSGYQQNKTGYILSENPKFEGILAGKGEIIAKEHGTQRVEENSSENKTIQRSARNRKCNTKTGEKDQIHESTSGTSLPDIVSRISLVDSEECTSVDTVDIDIKRKLPEENSVKQKSPLTSFPKPKKFPKSADSPRSFILAATRRQANGFSSLYMKRALKGSNVRKDTWNKIGENEHHHRQGKNKII